MQKNKPRAMSPIRWKLIRFIYKTTGVKQYKLENLSQRLCAHKELRDSDPEGGGSARCVACGKHMGHWFCPKSPDHRCYYNSEPNGDGSRHILLNGGTKHQITKEYRDADAEYETDDDCLFCHNPDERK